MAETYNYIASASISGASSITLSSIPNTYTDLVMVFTITGGNADNGWIKLNGSSSNYSTVHLSGNGSTATSWSQANAANFLYSSVTALQAKPQIFQLLNYANSNTYKRVIARQGDTTYGNTLYTGEWRDTSPVTSISINTQGYASLGTGTVTLYGIKAA